MEWSAHMIRDRRRWLIYILLLVMPFFFVGGPDCDSRQSLKELWNLGHFFFFTIFIVVQDSYWCSMHRSIYFRIGAAFITVTCVGLGIELLQLNIADRFFFLARCRHGSDGRGYRSALAGGTKASSPAGDTHGGGVDCYCVGQFRSAWRRCN